MNIRKNALRLAALYLAASAFAETHTIVADRYYRTFSHQNAVLKRIKPGDVVVTKTLDSGGQDDKDVHRHPESGNPLTGPFFIEGAEPGDAIRVQLRKVRLNRNWGYSVWRLALISLTPDSIEALYSDKYKPDLVRKGSQRLVPWDIDSHLLFLASCRLCQPKSRVYAERPTSACSTHTIPMWLVSVDAGTPHCSITPFFFPSQ